MLSLVLIALASLAPHIACPIEVAPDRALEAIEAPHLTDASTLGLPAVAFATQFPQGPVPPSTPPPTCQDLLNQITALEAEIAQLQLERAIAGQQTLALQELWWMEGCMDLPTPECDELSKDIMDLFELQGELIGEINAKRAALQQLLGLLAVMC